MMHPAALSIRDLCVDLRASAGRAPILENIDLEIARGQVLGLIGESGSGKTTLAHAALGILPRQAARRSGRISVAGSDVASLPRRVAYVPQDASTALDPLFTVATQIDDVLRARRPDLADRAARTASAHEMLRALQLADPAGLLRRRPHEVSGGQRQRLMIAMALLSRPALIVADEPTTALDATVQLQVLKLLRDSTRDQGVAILITTHDPGVAHEICDRVAVMYAGRIVEHDLAGRVLRSPRHPYTKRLLAARAGLPLAAEEAAAPTPFDRPAGCAFHPRCVERQPRCATEAPPVLRDAGRMVRCWNHAE